MTKQRREVQILLGKEKEVREYAKHVSEPILISETHMIKKGFKKKSYDEGKIDYVLANEKMYIHITESFEVFVRDCNDSCVSFPKCKSMFDLFKLMDMLDF
jgi:hypothetical protein